ARAGDLRLELGLGRAHALRLRLELVGVLAARRGLGASEQAHALLCERLRAAQALAQRREAEPDVGRGAERGRGLGRLALETAEPVACRGERALALGRL